MIQQLVLLPDIYQAYLVGRGLDRSKLEIVAYDQFIAGSSENVNDQRMALRQHVMLNGIFYQQLKAKRRQ
jgi:hypothetical protein